MTLSEESEQEEWLVRALAGDGSARARLLSFHREKLKRMVGFRLPEVISKRVDPSDIVQETMIQADKKLDEYLRTKPLPFYPWLRKLAEDQLGRSMREHAYALKRTVYREQNLESDLSEESVIKLARVLTDRGDEPLRMLLRLEAQSRLHDALNQLSSADREVLVLRYIEELSPADTAAVLQLDKSAAAMRHLRALQRLREILSNEFSDLENE